MSNTRIQTNIVEAGRRVPRGGEGMLPPKARSASDDELEHLRAQLTESIARDFDHVPTMVFQALLLRRRAFHVRHADWPTVARPSDIDWPALCSSTNHRLSGECAWVFDLGAVVVRLLLGGDGVAKASFAAADASDLDAAATALLTLLPPEATSAPFEESPVVPITFWSYGVRSSTRRRLPATSWSEVERNYAPTTRSLLEALIERPEDRDAGKLILWHGEPGTGKTYALRALAKEWQPWCEIHYVMDPEAFFGTPTSYMRDVLMNNDDYYHAYEEEGAPDSFTLDDDWRLIVLEDTGELLGVDAKLDTGQGLSRLLNLVDGLLGEGLKLLVLITTNEPLARMHPAVVRPGRCAAVVEFERLAAADANVWLESSGAFTRVSSPTTLAELYNLRAGGSPTPTTSKIGFA